MVTPGRAVRTVIAASALAVLAALCQPSGTGAVIGKRDAGLLPALARTVLS